MTAIHDDDHDNKVHYIFIQAINDATPCYRARHQVDPEFFLSQISTNFPSHFALEGVL